MVLIPALSHTFGTCKSSFEIFAFFTPSHDGFCCLKGGSGWILMLFGTSQVLQVQYGVFTG